MDDLPLPQEADRIAYLGVFDKAEDIVVCRAGFLLWCDLVKTTYQKYEEEQINRPTPNSSNLRTYAHIKTFDNGLPILRKDTA